ncbi:MAG: acetate/propionate family kinase [Nitrospirales bacterium]|nr:acetate/propionate family kinase [Nitrospira sp.]MDR4502515.1 acetate/propionate family kinase [Nitrospirales bacterium]
MRVLVINSGSSSIKFRVTDTCVDPGMMKRESSQSIIHGLLKQNGEQSTLEISGRESTVFLSECTHERLEDSFTWIFDSLKDIEKFENWTSFITTIEAVGHRVVHGGNRFSQSTIIDASVLQEIEQFNDLAPLHNPTCLAGIVDARTFFGHDMPMVAVFDTAYHRTLPAHAATYAIPYELSKRHRIKRYGFHGIAHASLASHYANHTEQSLKDQRIITLQLGNGCSMTAIAGGKSIDTTMGFSPSEGLMMGTRSGDLDPSIIGYLAKKEQVSVMGIQSWLNERSGLLGISGDTHDMRQLLQAARQKQDPRARLAIDMFCYRVQKYLGAYFAVLGGVNAIIFGGGIGENASEIRSKICDGLKWAGVHLNQERNKQAVGITPGEVTKISEDASPVAVYVIGTDEEDWIASETVRCLQAHKHKKLV